MSLLRVHETDDYWPEYSTLMIRDHWDHDLEVESRPELEALSEFLDHAQPCGSVARAGDGWLRAGARDADRQVRLEVHDQAPPDDLSDWDDVVETPYHCGVGSVVLDTVIPGDGYDHPLELGPPGFYRARVSRKCTPSQVPGFQAEEGDIWRVQFWPAPGAPQPPRWLARSEPALADDGDGWADILACVGGDVLYAARAATAVRPSGATAEEIDAAFFAGERPTGRLDEPIWQVPPEPLPTGHADLDQNEADIYQTVLADTEAERAELAEWAGQLSAPTPATRRDLLSFLVAAGVLTASETSGTIRYQVVPEPPRPENVLRLPEDRLFEMRQQNVFYRYAELAADIVSVAQWSPDCTATVDVPALAERLLASPELVQSALQYAQDESLLLVDGTRMTALPQEEDQNDSEPLPLAAPAGPPWTAGDGLDSEDADELGLKDGWEEPDWNESFALEQISDSGDTIVLTDGVATTEFLVVGTSGPTARSGYRPPLGEPARAGFVSEDGELVVWRGGRPVTLARLPGECVDHALETAYGIVLHQAGHRAILVRPDGHVQHLADEPDHAFALAEDGRHLAVSRSHDGRRSSTHRLLLIDLADGSTTTLPWPRARQIRLAAFHRGALYLTADDEDSLRLVPGAEPERLPYTPIQLDPLSGTLLAHSEEPGQLVILPDGTRRQIRVHSAEGLAPGGSALYEFRYEPSAVTLFGLETGASDPHVFWLPPGTETSTLVPGRPVWEDRDTLLFTVPDGNFGAVRLDIRTGEFQEVPLVGGADQRPALVQPLLTKHESN
ncbi:DUF6042 family protein [Actinomadura fulvescens]|uniref:Uncharacterized protein n=1 Tax=Actinomadura fulvescens TaxID=46160 RepID=A0ABN3P9J2_9ACTN